MASRITKALLDLLDEYKEVCQHEIKLIEKLIEKLRLEVLTGKQEDYILGEIESKIYLIGIKSEQLNNFTNFF